MAEGGSVVDIEWSCPACTYINKAGSFKCSVCGTPKGTATRQVKFHLSTLEQQYVAESLQFSRVQNARSLTRLQAHYNSPSSSSDTSHSKNEASDMIINTSVSTRGGGSVGAPVSVSVGTHGNVSVSTHSNISVGAHDTVSVGEHVSTSVGALVSVTVGECGSVPVDERGSVPVSERGSVSVSAHGTVSVGTASISGTVKKRQKSRMIASRSKVIQASKWPRLKNIDRSRIIRSQDITVNNVTVNITEYPLLYSDSE